MISKVLFRQSFVGNKSGVKRKDFNFWMPNRVSFYLFLALMSS